MYHARVFISKTCALRAARSNSIHSSPRSLSVPSISTIDCGEADCRLHNQVVVIRSPADALAARAGPLLSAMSMGGCFGEASHRHRQADRAGTRDTKHSRLPNRPGDPPASLPNAQTASVQASAARVPRPQLPQRWRLGVQHHSQQTGLHDRYVRLETGVEGPRGYGVSGCSGQAGARCVCLCLHQEASTGARRGRRGLCSIGKRSRSPWRRNQRPALLCATLAVRLPVQPYRRHSPPPSQSSIPSAHNRIPHQFQLLWHLTTV